MKSARSLSRDAAPTGLTVFDPAREGGVEPAYGLPSLK